MTDPAIGLIFWTVIIFSLLLILLKKFAWKPINNAVKNREGSIRAALEAADKAKAEMEKLTADNEKVMQEARQERDLLMKEAREVKEKIILEAKQKADVEAKHLIEQARVEIQNEKMSALNDLKDQVAMLSVEIAERIIREKLVNDKAQKDLINKLLDDVKLN
jgi:F-type H+-transporting ATPase subunit b